MRIAKNLKYQYVFLFHFPVKVFQEMMFKKNDDYDLWWTGQQFKDMRTEACEQMLQVSQQDLDNLWQHRKPMIAIGHFHDLCPLALARKAMIEKVGSLFAYGQRHEIYTATNSIKVLIKMCSQFENTLPANLDYSWNITV